MCITGEKNLDSVWKELAEEFEEDMQWRVARVESIAQARFWRLRPDGIDFRPHTKSKSDTFCILEFKRMSDSTDQYLIRAKTKVNNIPDAQFDPFPTMHIYLHACCRSWTSTFRI